jgi:tetratricopeptide (TPR) repeat protein
VKILTDDPEVKPLLKFEENSDPIVQLLRNQRNISIGIFGDWGTGKTTFMQLIEAKLTESVIDWKSIDSSDRFKVLKYLERKYGIRWEQEDIKIIAQQQVVIFENSKDRRKIQFTLHDNANIKPTGKVSKIVQSLKSLGKEILKENEIVNNFLTDPKQVIFQIDGQQKDEFFAYVDSNNRITIYLEDFENECIISCWFNPWKHELDVDSISTALLKRIAFSIVDHPVFFNLKPMLVELTKKFLGKLSEELFYKLLSNVSDDPKKFVESVSNDIYKLTFDSEKKSIYYDGGIILEKQLAQIRKRYPHCNIVVFIDDLDRCSLKTVLELFESIKVVTDLEGFSYVIGLSDRLVQEILTEDYGKIGLTKSQSTLLSSQYINKIIQIPYRIPEHSSESILQLLNYYLKSFDNEQFISLILDNAEFVIYSCRLNPRDLKRLLNFIRLRLNYFSLKEFGNLTLKQFLFVIIFYHSWGELYQEITSNENFRAVFNKLLRLQPADITQVIKPEDNVPLAIDHLSRNFYFTFFVQTHNDFISLDSQSKTILASIPPELWKHLTTEQNIIRSIEWEELSPYFMKKNKQPISGLTISQSTIPSLLNQFNKYFYNDKKYFSALRICKQLVEINPNNGMFYNAIANCFLALGELEKSISYYEKAFEILNSSFIMINEGNAYDQLSQLDPTNKDGHLTNAIRCFTRALDVDPNNVSINNFLGGDYLFLGQVDRALNCFNTVLKKNENDTIALNGAAMIYANKKDYEKAIDTFKKILTQNLPNPSIIYFDIALAYEAIFYSKGLDLSNISEAKQWLRKANQVSPNNMDIEIARVRLNETFPNV